LRNPVTGLRRPIRAVGVRPGDDVFLDPAVRAHARALKGPETAVFDVSGKTDVYGVSSVGVRTELAGRPIHLVGAFRLGADFLNDGTLVMTDRNYAHYFGGPNGVDPDRLAVDLGLLKLTRRGDRALAERVKNEVARVLPASVTVCTKDELIEGERDFWLTNTPIGFVFTLGLVMGFVVGTIICYQIFFSDITSYLREYATLLAMGYSRGYLVSVVLQEAVYLGFLGFACGTLVSLGVYAAAQEETRLPFVMDAGRALVVLGATLAMCVTAACFAIQKLWRAAPAELF
jgi:putative ABC transport system permease protein